MEKFRSASVPHIKFDLPRKQFSHFSIHTRAMQCGWEHSGKFALFFTILLMIAILVPYTIGLANGNIRPLLPLISLMVFTAPGRHHSYDQRRICSTLAAQASAEPSQNGIFNIMLYITAIIGGVMVSVRYVHVSSQNESRNWRLNVLNKLGLTSGFVSFGGLIVVASFPVSIRPVEQEQWESSVFVPHMMGAFFAFFFGALYLLFQTCLSLFFYEGNGRLVLLRFTLFLLCAVCFVASTLSTISSDNAQQTADIYLQADVITKPLKEPSVVRSVCEWMMVFFFAVYFLTFVKESQKISVVITFRHLITGRRISIASLTNMSKI